MSTTVDYVNNREMLNEIITSRNNGQITFTLGQMFIQLCDKMGEKTNFVGYSYLDDMKGFALYNIVKTWKKFNPEQSNNPFSFFTQSIYFSFLQYIKSEKKQQHVVDREHINEGLNPSSNFTYTYPLKPERKRRRVKKQTESIAA